VTQQPLSKPENSAISAQRARQADLVKVLLMLLLTGAFFAGVRAPSHASVR
jgi:hypothetical protein